MKLQKVIRKIIGLTFVLLVLVACSLLNTRQPSNPTQIPITDTSIPVTPSNTSEPNPIVSPTTSMSSVTQQNPLKYRTVFTVTVKNDGFTLNHLIVYQPRPIEWDGQKEMNIESVSPEPTGKTEDPVFGNGLYYWDLTNHFPGNGESLEFKMQFTFTSYEITAHINPNDIQSYDTTSPLFKLYTRPEEFIESADPQIIGLADQIAAGEENPYLLAKKFYDYIVENAHYRLVGKGLLGAKALLNNGEGECGDYSALFIALSRAKGIPARSVVGYWAITGAEQTHVWAEFYLEGIGWVPVDPTIGQQSKAKETYYFGNMDNQRVILEKGFNIPMEPAGPDNYLAPLMQGPSWWYWGNGDGNKMNIAVAWNVIEIR
jgi:transglutaminase-like putative cysteine protease